MAGLSAGLQARRQLPELHGLYKGLVRRDLPSHFNSHLCYSAAGFKSDHCT